MIQSILIAKLYIMAYKFNIEILIKAILKKILKFISLLILYIDLKFIYNYIVKLNII